MVKSLISIIFKSKLAKKYVLIYLYQINEWELFLITLLKLISYDDTTLDGSIRTQFLQILDCVSQGLRVMEDITCFSTDMSAYLTYNKLYSIIFKAVVTLISKYIYLIPQIKFYRKNSVLER